MLTFAASGLGAMLLGMALLVSSRLVLAPGDYARFQFVEMTLKVLGWVLILVGSFGLCLGATPLGLLGWVAAVVVVSHVMVRRRTAKQYSLLWVLTAASERGLPLSTSVGALAHEGCDEFARRTRGLYELLDQGASLPEALKRCPGLLPTEATPLVHVGFDCGALAPALRQSAGHREAHTQVWASVAGKLIYVLVMIWFLLYVVQFIFLKIIPSFQKIFYDFDAEPTLSMQVLVSTGNFVAQWAFLVFLLMGMLGALLIYALLWYVGWLRWELPGMSRFTRRLHTASILDAMTLAVRCRCPLDDVFASLVRWYPTRWVRKRLRAAQADVAGGRDWLDALSAQGLLPQADVAVLRSAQRADNLQWALGEMADANRRRLAYRLQTLVQFAFPPVVLLFGLAVGLVGLALLSSLAQLVLRVI